MIFLNVMLVCQFQVIPDSIHRQGRIRRIFVLLFAVGSGRLHLKFLKIKPIAKNFLRFFRGEFVLSLLVMYFVNLKQNQWTMLLSLSMQCLAAASIGRLSELRCCQSRTG